MSTLPDKWTGTFRQWKTPGLAHLQKGPGHRSPQIHGKGFGETWASEKGQRSHRAGTGLSQGWHRCKALATGPELLPQEFS